jgi:crotonobetainyl-CoA:carnitine CoA-transferase CaiB-like acyl-CoA transferase
VAIGANSGAIFKRLMKVIGRPELGEDPRYQTNTDRAEHAEELDNLINVWTKQHPLKEILQILDEARVPAGAIYSVTEIMNDEQYHAREMILETEVKGIGSVKMPGLVPKLSATPGKVEWYGDSLGAHNEDIYRGLLGLSAEELERLSREGVI